jgi:hypothetical protein
MLQRDNCRPACATDHVHTGREQQPTHRNEKVRPCKAGHNPNTSGGALCKLRRTAGIVDGDAIPTQARPPGPQYNKSSPHQPAAHATCSTTPFWPYNTSPRFPVSVLHQRTSVCFACCRQITACNPANLEVDP